MLKENLTEYLCKKYFKKHALAKKLDIYAIQPYLPIPLSHFLNLKLMEEAIYESPSSCSLRTFSRHSLVSRRTCRNAVQATSEISLLLLTSVHLTFMLDGHSILAVSCVSAKPSVSANVVLGDVQTSFLSSSSRSPLTKVWIFNLFSTSSGTPIYARLARRSIPVALSWILSFSLWQCEDNSKWLTSFKCLLPYFLSNASMIAANSVLFPSGIIWIISAAVPLKEIIKATALSSSSHIFFVATTPNCRLKALKLVVPSNRAQQQICLWKGKILTTASCCISLNSIVNFDQPTKAIFFLMDDSMFVRDFGDE
uniref:Uncharacterized protein n=1 Tax=Glossina austeni TaxID=7395 RepID=A0A1A9US63_GLOAU